MKIAYKTGNLLEATEKVIVHGCNSKGVMGSGVAAAIRAKYPNAYTEYRKIFEKAGLTLGSTVWVQCDPHMVVNAITQETFGRDPDTVYVSYDAIREVVRGINKIAKASATWPSAPFDASAVAFPLIGAGLANGSWSVIAAIIEEESPDFQPVVYLLDGKIPE